MRQPSSVGFAMAIVAAVIVLYALYVLRHAWLLIYVAVVLAIMFDPAVRLVGSLRLRGWHPGRGLSVAAVSLVVLAIFTGIVLFIVPPIAADAGRLQAEWPRMSAQAIDWIHRHLPFSRSVSVASIMRLAREWTGGSPVRTLSASLFDILTVLLVGVYLLVDASRILQWGLSFVPARHREATHDAFIRAGRRMQRWAGGQALLMLTHGGSALLVFWLIGLPYFLALGVFAGLINVIPFLGPILTLIVAGLIAAMEAPRKLLGVVVFYLIYHNVEGIVLQPRIMSHAVGVPGVTVVIALLIGYDLAGIVGMLVSVPTAVLLAELKTDFVG
jgi:predicted PurR-regulated permease PerM